MNELPGNEQPCILHRASSPFPFTWMLSTFIRKRAFWSWKSIYQGNEGEKVPKTVEKLISFPLFPAAIYFPTMVPKVLRYFQSNFIFCKNCPSRVCISWFTHETPSCSVNTSIDDVVRS